MSKMPKKQTLEHAALNPSTNVTTPASPTGSTSSRLPLGAEGEHRDADGDDLDDVQAVVAGGLEASMHGVVGEGEEAMGRSKRFKEVWLVEDRKNSRSVWTRVGAAFENADGSWNIRLSAVPVGGGRLNVRDPLPRERPVTA